jgi:hypothetical protein
MLINHSKQVYFIIMRKIVITLFFWCFSFTIHSQTDKVTIDKSLSGLKLKVNGKDFIVNGMNWDYYPIGTTYSYSIWQQPDNFIQEALDAEMT